MLVWHTHNEGNHAILARNENSILLAFKAVFDKYEAEPKQYWKIRIVAPPQAYLETCARNSYNDDVRCMPFRLSDKTGPRDTKVTF